MHRREFLASAAIATAFLVAAPSIAPVWAQDAPQAVVESYLAAWNAHDSAKAATHFADNVTYYDASVGTPVEGREAAKTGVIDNFLNAVPDAEWKMKGKPIVQDGRVSFEWEFSGTNTGNWATAPRPPARASSSTVLRCSRSPMARSPIRPTITTRSASTNNSG